MKREGQKSRKGLSGSLARCSRELECGCYLPSSEITEEDKWPCPTLLLDHTPPLAPSISEGFLLHSIMLERLLVTLPPSHGVLSMQRKQTILLILPTL